MPVDSSKQLLNRMSSLEKQVQCLLNELDSLKDEDASDRFEALEAAVKDLKNDNNTLLSVVDKLNNDGTRYSTHLEDLRVQTGRLIDTAERIKSLEAELKSVNEKLVRYEVKLASIEQLKNLLWGLLVAVVPATIAGAVELTKLFMQVHP